MAPVATAPTTSQPAHAAVQDRPAKAAKSSHPNVSVDLSRPPIIDLYSGQQQQQRSEADVLKDKIIAGLKGHQTLIVPGSHNNPDDLQFVYRKTLPTEILYDEKGLKIYDQLVDVPEYYLWNAETSILKEYGDEIALRIFGHHTPATKQLLQEALSQEQYQQHQRKEQLHRNHRKHDQDGGGGGGEAPVFDGLRHEQFQLAKEKWGDVKVGRFNGGVNSEHGFDGDKAANHANQDALVELGAGSLRKTIHLLSSLKHLPDSTSKDEQAQKVQYYALDLDKSELERTLQDLRVQLAGNNSNNQQHAWSILDGKVGIHGMWATYDQGLQYIGQGGLDKQAQGKRCFLWLGSSIGNFERRDAAEFLKTTADTALRSGDTMLIGIDRRNSPKAVELAYHDTQGVTTSFIMNGLDHADRVLRSGGHNKQEEKILDSSKFEYCDRYNVVEGRHESYYRSKVEQHLSLPDGSQIDLEEGELIHIERSYKYSERETLDALDHAGLRVVQKWTTTTGGGDVDAPKYDLWLVEKPPFYFPSTRLLTGWRHEMSQGLTVAQAHNTNGSYEYDADGGSSALTIGEQPRLHSLWGSWGVPSPREWHSAWKSWDTITLTMISRDMLHQKPIDLRHICLFYLGHIPAFVDIMLLKVLPDLEPLDAHYNTIFERGIDPHVDDPTQCHAHSEVPTKEEDWPKVEEILAYRERIMERVDGIYNDVAQGKRVMNRRLARALRMVMEHVELHQETLLYMLVQSPGTLPPAGFSLPDWHSLSKRWDIEDELQGGKAARQALYHFKADSITIGHDDDDTKDLDVETTKPTDDITDLNSQLGNPEFGWDNEHPAYESETGAFSISAAPVNNEDYLEYLQAQQAENSDNLKAKIPSSWMESSVTPGVYLVRTVFGPVPFSVARLWPVQTSGKQLCEFAEWKGGRLPTQTELRRFMDSNTSPNCTDRPGSNVGFNHWHPVPSTLPRTDGDNLRLPGHNGGVWEWTSTAFMGYEGFQISELYPGYSHDFFDGKHSVVLGASWATTASVAGRRTVKNTYQKDYPYSFIGGRVVYDSMTRVKGGRKSLSPVRSR
ncbi:unnamed protein product [Sympodiomycopsis kandeliae]